MTTTDTAPGSVAEGATLLAGLRSVFAGGRTRSLAWRLDQLHGIERLVQERESEIATALSDDLGRSAMEAWLGDVASTKAEAAFARKHLKKWMRRPYSARALKIMRKVF